MQDSARAIKDTKIAKMLQDCYLAHLLVEASAIMECESDPNGAKDEFLSLAKKCGRKYLPRDKRKFAYYKVPILWQIYIIYPLLKSAERRFRRWRKSLFRTIRINPTP